MNDEKIASEYNIEGLPSAIPVIRNSLIKHFTRRFSVAFGVGPTWRIVYCSFKLIIINLILLIACRLSVGLQFQSFARS